MKGKKRLERLEPRLKETYQVLQDLEAEIGAPPTVREVVKRMGLNAKYISRVYGDLEELTTIGLVRRLPIPTRCFKATGPAPEDVDWEALLI